MAEITLNGIKYSNVNVDQAIVSKSVKNSRSQFVTNDKIDTTKLINIYNAVDNGNVQWSNMAFINALEIDWNGAQLPLPEDLNLGTTIKLLLAECIWSLETILNEKVHLTSGVHFCC